MNTIVLVVKKVWNWLVYSSADPTKISLTLKGAIPFLVIFLGWKGVDQAVVQQFANEGVDLTVNIIILIVQLGTALTAFVGLVRKLRNTVQKVSA